jgi:nicotinate-nucleotide--dimethylbenzimidazole phosphoribosyltransferase
MDIVGTGEMGIGNSTAASAITAVYTQQPVEELTGRGTGIDDTGLKRKIAVIKKALQLNQPNPSDALDVLSKVGGFEIGGLAGVILGCSQKRIPVVIDGFISGAAALIACGLAPKSRQYLIASHCSAEPGHQAILKYLGLKALLDLNLRLGEGTGAALGIWLCQAAVKLLVEMATFEGAQVSRKIKA